MRQGFRVIGEQAHGDPGKFARRAALTAHGLSVGVAKLGGFQAKNLRLSVHAGHKFIHRACHAFGKGHGRIIRAQHDHGAQQLGGGEPRPRIGQRTRATARRHPPGLL